jgi:hypothetical protein
MCTKRLVAVKLIVVLKLAYFYLREGIMKKVFISILLAFVLSIIGISVGGCHGLGETAAERSDDHKRQMKLHNQMFIDDVDAIFQTDRPSRLTEDTVR